MSRLADIIENHEQLDQLNMLLKHYGVSAEFVTACVIEQFGGKEGEEGEEADEGMMADFKQFYATF